MSERGAEAATAVGARASTVAFRPLQLLVATALLWTLLLAGFAALRYGGDLRGLFLLGSELPHPPVFAGAPTTGPIGYDGQFFGALATDPLLLDPATPTYVSGSIYRAGRIGLPLLAWALAGGNPSRSVLLYQLLCWALAVSVVWVAARWLQDRGRSPLWATPLALGAGLLSSMVSSLPDAAAVALLLLALDLHRRQHPGAVAVLCFSCLTRETGLIVAAAIALSELRARRVASAIRFAGLPVALVIGWRVWLIHRGLADQSGNALGLPLGWVRERLAQPFPPSEVLGFVALGLAVAALVAAGPRLREWTAVEASYAGFVLLAFALNGTVYEGIWSYSRVLLALPVFATVIASGCTGARRWAFQAVPLAFAVAAIAKLAPEVLGRVR